MKSYFSSPNLMVAGYYHDFNGITYYFKENGNVIIEDVSLGATFRYGTYHINDNEITIREDNKLFSHQLMINKNELYYKEQKVNAKETSKTNSKNSNLKIGISLTIREDNR